MELLQLSAPQIALLGTLIIGTNELLVRARAKDWWVVATIASAAVIGGLFGVYYNLDFLVGVSAGLSASGTLKLLSSVTKGSTPAPSDVVK